MSAKGRPDHVPGIVAYLKKRLTENKVQTPDIGIICGSGLGGLAATLSNQYVVPYEDIKGFPQSTVAGHVSELVFGTLGGKNVVCMKGRFHYYEGYEPWQVGLPVRVMAALGIKVLIVTNAAGGVNPGYHIGDLMIIKDQICAPGLAGNHPLVGHNDERFGVRFPAVSPIFDTELMQLVETSHAKIESKMRLHRGVYFGVSGPSYETPHEIGMIRILKGDSVGMSTVFEILTAAHCGIKLLGLSLITNRCLGPDDNWPAPTHEEVLDSVKNAGTNIQALVSEVVSAMNTDKLPRTKGYDFFQKPPADQSTASLHGRIVDLESLGSSSTHVSSDVKDGKRSGQASSESSQSEGGCCGNSGGCGSGSSSNTKKESCGDKQGCGAKCGDESGGAGCCKKKRCGDGGCGRKKRCGGGFHKGHCCPYKNPGMIAAAVAVVAVSAWLLRCAFKGNCNKGSCGKC